MIYFCALLILLLLNAENINFISISFFPHFHSYHITQARRMHSHESGLLHISTLSAKVSSAVPSFSELWAMPMVCLSVFWPGGWKSIDVEKRARDVEREREKTCQKEASFPYYVFIFIHHKICGHLSAFAIKFVRLCFCVAWLVAEHR